MVKDFDDFKEAFAESEACERLQRNTELAFSRTDDPVEMMRLMNQLSLDYSDALVRAYHEWSQNGVLP